MAAAGKDPSAGSATPRLLDGVRVLELGQFIAAPLLTRMMADVGAEVIKLEMAPGGDTMRGFPPFFGGQAAGFVQQNRGKRSVCIDLGNPRGIEIAYELVRHADVLVENFSPGVLERRGLGYAKLAEINPRLIMCSISGYGQTGPYANWPGTDPVAQAMSGLMHITGDPDGAPVYIGTAITDENASVHGLAAIAMALFYRERTGRGQCIDLSLVECMFHLQDIIANYVFSRGAVVPNRFGQHHSGLAPRGVFQARGRYVVIAVQPRQWERFVEATKIAVLSSDARFQTAAARVEHRFALAEIIEGWLRSFPNADVPLSILRDNAIMCAPVLDIGEAMHDPHMQSRGAMQEIDQPGFGPVPLPKSPFHFSQAVVEIPGPSPRLGEHNAEVLHRVAGYSRQAVEELTREGVLVETPANKTPA
ncbi:MAG TPA: CoA transferase [Candidatus Binataceae bacterium]|jgi:CoA:oxalate CoA-transferase|nr:CoA transferase [Candidatus Binataceae bacterium]